MNNDIKNVQNSKRNECVILTKRSALNINLGVSSYEGDASMLRDVKFRVKMNVKIIVIAIVLMFIGPLISSMITLYYPVYLWFGTILGTLICTSGNLVLLRVEKRELVKTFSLSYTADAILAPTKKERA